MTQQNLQPITRELIGALRQTGAQVQENEPMSLHTSFQIGGPADVFATVSDERSLRGVLKLCKEAGAPVYVIGNGSDLLIPDQGLRGVVVSFGGDLCRLRLENETTIVCGPGATLAKLCKFALENSLTGLEFAWGIPGSAGGAAYMNAGAYGGEMKDVLIKCRHMDENGNPGEFAGSALDFSYRHSAYTDQKLVITGLTFQLEKGDYSVIKAQMEDYLGRRKARQPLEYPSAGSVFKRPKGYFAGQLIEECGLKGKTVGGAQVSEKHAGFIVNTGGATCKDVQSLVKMIQETVRREKQVELECEIKLMT